MEKNYKVFLFTLLIILAGLASGYILANMGKAAPASGEKSKTTQSTGIADKKTFKDAAEGVLKEGGIEGEGNFHLERPGGKSQNVYLTSSAVDLSEYVGKKVKVRGETFKAEKAGWLMDVGLVEVVK